MNKPYVSAEAGKRNKITRGWIVVNHSPNRKDRRAMLRSLSHWPKKTLKGFESLKTKGNGAFGGGKK